jgi:hypothetical protein
VARFSSPNIIGIGFCLYHHYGGCPGSRGFRDPGFRGRHGLITSTVCSQSLHAKRLHPTLPLCLGSSNGTMACRRSPLDNLQLLSPGAAVGTAKRRHLFLKVLELVRQRYGFVILRYVVMPEHIHLLISEPKDHTPSTIMQVLKLGLPAGYWRSGAVAEAAFKASFSPMYCSESGRRGFMTSTFVPLANAWCWIIALVTDFPQPMPLELFRVA